MAKLIFFEFPSKYLFYPRLRNNLSIIRVFKLRTLREIRDFKEIFKEIKDFN